MELTTQQIQLIKRSWRSLHGIPQALIADMFYSKLFASNPRLRKLFPADMDQQYRKLIDMLNRIVVQLDEPDALEQEIAWMAQRHAGYGVKPVHYTLVGNALLWTLERGLGKDWNEQTAEAWKGCYQKMAGAMRRSCQYTTSS